MGYGLDSLMVMDVVRRCKRDLRVSIKASQMFERATLTEWVSMVDAEFTRVHGGQAQAGEREPAPPRPVTPAGPAAPAGSAPTGSAAPARTAPAGLADPTDPAWIRAGVTLDPAIRPAGGYRVPSGELRHVLLTGATGFLGAFLLDELLRRTPATVHCLVRCTGQEDGLRRVWANYERYLPRPEEPDEMASRVTVVPGDLERPLLGLGDRAFDELASRLDSIFHNGAWVNFSYTYDQLRAANLAGKKAHLFTPPAAARWRSPAPGCSAGGSGS